MKNQKKILGLILGILVAALSLLLDNKQTYPVESQTEGNAVTSTPHVVRIVDGDTFEIQVGSTREKVRMLGIDTPESVDPRKKVQCFGKEATKKLQELIDGKDVELEADLTNDDRDKYGRLLRYVRTANISDVNAEMIRQGYAYAYIKFPFARRAEYLKLQTEARSMGRGLWATTTCSGRR